MSKKQFYIGIVLTLFVLFSLFQQIISAQTREDLIIQALENITQKWMYTGSQYWGWMDVGWAESHEISPILNDQKIHCSGHRAKYWDRWGNYWGEINIFDCGKEIPQSVIDSIDTYYIENFAPGAVIFDKSKRELFGIPVSWSDIGFGSDEIVKPSDDSGMEGVPVPWSWRHWVTAWQINGLIIYAVEPWHFVTLSDLLGEGLEGPIGVVEAGSVEIWIYCELLRLGLISGSPSNNQPVIERFSFQPEKPNRNDTVIFEVEAKDEDGEFIEYTWERDGVVVQGETTNSMSWTKIPPGNHEVTVSACDCISGVSKRTITVVIASKAGDRDGDDILDGMDLCPDEAGPEPDGCPPFSVSIQCNPPYPDIGQQVNCTAKPKGVRENEQIEYLWYLNYTHDPSATSPSFSFLADVIGNYYVGIEMAGEGRVADADVVVEVGEKPAFQVRLSQFPEEPVEDYAVAFYAQVNGADDGQPIHYQWKLDGNDAGDDQSIWVWDDADYGNHAVSVEIEQDEKLASASLDFLVTDALLIPDDAGSEAGFSLDLDCNSEFLNDQPLECTARITRQSEKVVLLDVWWLFDAATVFSEQIVGDRSAWILQNPPPGDFEITVVISDPLTGLSRVTVQKINILSDSGALLIPILFRASEISPRDAAITAVGTTALFGLWLLAETQIRKRTIDWKPPEEKDRADWYEQQMAINDERRARRRILDAYDSACETEAKRFRDSLLDTLKKTTGSESLIDIYDDLVQKIRATGNLDLQNLKRLQELINNKLKIDRQEEAMRAWKREWDFLNRMQTDFTEITSSGPAVGMEIITSLLTSGASKLIFMPTRAIGNALYASKRSRLLGKTGWDAAKYVMVEAGTHLAWDYGYTKAGEYLFKGIGKAGKWGLKRTIGKEGMEKIANWWQRTSERFFKPPTPEKKLPVIQQYWEKGPRVYTDRPLPGHTPMMSLGKENFINNHIRPLNNALANDIDELYTKGFRINPKVNNILKAGELYPVSKTDEIAVRLMNNTSYKLAVNQGLIPPATQQFVYQVRDKLCKNAMQKAILQLDNIYIDGNSASSYIKGVAITGTGARPLTPEAIDRLTDFDGTALAGDSSAQRQAELLYSKAFYENLRNPGKANLSINPEIAEVKMFNGIHPGELGVDPGAYVSEPMLHWQKVDMINRGRLVVRGKDSKSLIFDNHPDVEPLEGMGPIQKTVPRFPRQPALAKADAAGIVRYRVTRTLFETGRQMTKADIIKEEGKQVVRAWKSINAGRSLKTPGLIKRLAEIKRNPDIRLSPEESEKLWQAMSEYLDLPYDLGA